MIDNIKARVIEAATAAGDAHAAGSFDAGHDYILSQALATGRSEDEIVALLVGAMGTGDYALARMLRAESHGGVLEQLRGVQGEQDFASLRGAVMEGLGINAIDAELLIALNPGKSAAEIIAGGRGNPVEQDSGEAARLRRELAEAQQTIADLQKQVDELKAQLGILVPIPGAGPGGGGIGPSA